MKRNEVYELLNKMRQECNGCDYWSGKDCTLVSPEKGCDRQTKNASKFKRRVLDEIDREIGVYSDDTTEENLVAVIVLLKLSRVISEWRDEE